MSSDEDYTMDTMDTMNTMNIMDLENIYDYNSHLNLISKLRECANLEATRNARKRFSSLLLPKVSDWISWIEDELEISSTVNADDSEIKLIFEAALKDYPVSIDLWLKYLKFNSNLDNFKRAAAFPAWNLQNGQLLLKLDDAAILSAARAIPYTLKAKNELNLHQFAQKFDLTPSPFESFEQNFPQNIEKYIETVKSTKLLSSANKLTLCRVLFERALEIEVTSFKLWRDYLKFLRLEMNVSSVILSVNHRLIRAHPLNVDSWIILFENLELFGKFEEIEDIWKNSLPALLLESSHETFIALQLARLDFFRRHNSNSVVIVCTEVIKQERELFGPGAVDSEDRLLRYLAQIYYSRNEIEEFRNIWQNLLKNHAKEAGFWLEYLQMEKFLSIRDSSQLPVIRNGFRRAISGVTDYPETIFYEWIQFERQHGDTLENLFDARDRIEKQREILKLRAEKAHQASQNSQNSQNSRKRSRIEVSTAAVPVNVTTAVKEEKTHEKSIKSFNPDATLFVNNLPFNFTETDIENHFNNLITKLPQNLNVPEDSKVKSIRMHMNQSGNSFKGHATIEFESAELCKMILENFNRQPADESGRPVFLAKYVSPLEAKKTPESLKLSESDAKTLFVSNLPVNESTKVEELFKTLRGIQQIRHIPGKQFCYIEFEDEIKAQEALKMIPEIDKSVKVAFSNPPTKSATVTNVTRTTSNFLKPRSLTIKK